MDGFRATIGVTGPPSLAETLQTGWHNLFGYRKPLGWAEQMPFEPAFAVSYLGARTVTASSAASGVALTPAAVWALTAGTLRTSGMLGLRAAFGAHAPPPWESTAHRELGAGTAVYLIAGVQGEVVARDMFLDGTLFRESPSVSRRWIVGQVEGGVGLTLGRVRLEWAVIHRAREYSTQPAPHTFARILMGWD
jgi:hypothetical protein